MPARKLREWAAELAGIPAWLFDECYHAVGDLAETVALELSPSARSTERPLHEWVEDVLLPLRGKPETQQKGAICDAWEAMNDRQRYVWNKLITGSFRVGVSQALVTRALAQVADLLAPLIAHRLMGDWTPTPAVRTVTPAWVFELAFEGIQRSSRHKCGIAVRFPRILRWRADKKPQDADTLTNVEALLPDVRA